MGCGVPEGFGALGSRGECSSKLVPEASLAKNETVIKNKALKSPLPPPKKNKTKMKLNKSVRKGVRANRKPGLRGNHVFLALSLGMRSTALMGSASMEAVLQSGKGVFQKTSNVWDGRIFQGASV